MAHCPGTVTNCRPYPRQATAKLVAGMVAAAAGLGAGLAACREEEEYEVVENWSSTHSVKTKSYLQPDSLQEVEQIISKAHEEGQRVRVVGNALSPSGLGLSKDTMLSVGLCDRVLRINKKRQTVTVEAGARVQQVVDALAPHGLTLQNYASISEQQLGGFLQVGAHGTGATIPPVDEQIVALKLVTPAFGTIELSNRSNPDLFRLVKVGLGALGVVTEVTIKCVPRHHLVETTSVMTRDEVHACHHSLLRENKHLRYMWIPYTDMVVVVGCNDLGVNEGLQRRKTRPPGHMVTCDGLPEGKPVASREVYTAEECLQPMRDLLLGHMGKTVPPHVLEEVNSKNFAALRDNLLALAPLDTEWVKKVNASEAEFWRRSQGNRVDFSDRILGFECGGQQWVNEVAFPTGTMAEPNGNDLNYIEELLKVIEENGLPAPAPIEQRWTASSSAEMSPAHDKDSSETVYSWVGIILYLPTEDPEVRQKIAEAFFRYRDQVKAKLWGRFDCMEHWAKLEMPRTEEEAKEIRSRLHRRFPISEFNSVRQLLDPKNIMANDHIDVCLGKPGVQ
ncbi:unnamed protein product [Discosporangium mesarthrocarpum]